MIKRIPAIDSIRGLLLVMMTLYNFLWMSTETSTLLDFTLPAVGLIGGVEAFVLLSGLLGGIVYRDTPKGFKELRAKSWWRAFSILRYHLISLLIVYAWFGICHAFLPAVSDIMQPNISSLSKSPEAAIFLSLMLINKPIFFDILPLFILFMLALPFLIAAYRRGWMWWVIVTSFVLWFGSNVFATTQTMAQLLRFFSEHALQLGTFSPLSWQLLFVIGSAIGFSTRQDNFFWHSKAVAALCVAVIAAILTIHDGVLIEPNSNLSGLYLQAEQSTLSWFRVVNCLAWAYLVTFVWRMRASWLEFRVLSYIGRHSLLVFSWHVVMLYWLTPLIMLFRATPYFDLLCLGALLSNWLVVWCKTTLGNLQMIHRLNLYAGLIIAGTISLAVMVMPSEERVSPSFREDIVPLTVVVEGIKASGDIMLLVFDESDNLMGVPSVLIRSYSVAEAREGIKLPHIPAGNYGVMAYQDSDGDSRLTMGVGGRPKEGLGYSNNPNVHGVPGMEQVMFPHPEASQQVIQLRYF
uniref:OpgC domain-containing protein n=1 Tax=Thaumasiovibrio occultus TaxID=1891184 RepID=UPI000B363133|nr:OpgC domain-containing protein [Thaumasiovibrio occultus]